MKFSNPGNLKTDIEYMFDPLVTSNDPSWPLMTSKQKIKKLWLYAYQMKDSYPGSKKIEKNTILDHLMTSNDC